MSHTDIHEIDTLDFYSYEHLLSSEERELDNVIVDESDRLRRATSF
jgi:hypothetical protein